MDTIKKLSGKSFEWKEGNHGTKFGFIAQEVEKVVPEIVSGSGDEYRTMETTAIIPLLVEAIKELSEKIDRLEALVGN